MFSVTDSSRGGECEPAVAIVELVIVLIVAVEFEPEPNTMSPANERGLVRGIPLVRMVLYLSLSPPSSRSRLRSLGVRRLLDLSLPSGVGTGIDGAGSTAVEAPEKPGNSTLSEKGSDAGSRGMGG